jgi:hypothetical protein
MNEKNYEYLINQLKHTGFGDTLNEDLRKNMEKQNPEFALSFQKQFENDKVSATLHFKKSDQFEMYFFNKYDLQLNKEANDSALKQTFYNDKGITLKEAYNLLDGRAVNKMQLAKDGEKFNAWLQLDFTKNTESGNYQFKQYHQNYGFDLEKTLSKYPIKELNNETYKANLIRSLERGNLQSATFQLNGKEEKIYITPNLAFKTLHAFDEKNQKVSLSNLLEKNKQEQTNKQENKQEITENPQQKKTNKIKNEDGIPAPKTRKRQKITQ